MKRKTPKQLLANNTRFPFNCRLPVGALNWIADEKERTGVSKERIVLKALQAYSGQEWK